jgi:hypothetical protein
VDPGYYNPEGVDTASFLPPEYLPPYTEPPLQPPKEVTIARRVVRVPQGAVVGGVVTENPKMPYVSYIRRGKSYVYWNETGLLEWRVALEDEADFAEFHAAFDQ